MNLSKEKQKFWQTHISAQAASGKTVAQYCREHSIVSHQFKYHKNKGKITQLEKIPKFTPIKIKKPSTIDIGIAGVKVSFNNDTDPSLIAKLIVEVGKAHA